MLSIKDCYGYELVNEISKTVAISEGTIYPLLRRLKKEGYVTTYLRESAEGPPRKYYKMTEEGVQMKEDLTNEWRSFVSSVNQLIEGGDESE